MGNIYPGLIRVVIKEYKKISRPGGKSADSLSQMQKEARHEARIISQFLDHHGLPLLFGVCLNEMPVSIVLKFNGEGNESLTIYKAAKTKCISDKLEWNKILWDTADALQHIHEAGYVHNDLKSNNVVLEKREDDKIHPVIIDFGKSVVIEKAKKAAAKPLHLRGHYKHSYIAPELINGTGRPSIESDVFALGFLIKTVYKLLKFQNISTVKDALIRDSPNNRPSISDLKEALSCADI